MSDGKELYRSWPLSVCLIDEFPSLSAVGQPCLPWRTFQAQNRRKPSSGS